MILRVFIVDGSAELVKALSETLSNFQLALPVGSATTELYALAWLDAHPQGWDVLVLEPHLESGNGLVLLQKCSARAAGQKVLVLTHYATDEMRRYCLAQGADAVFDKSAQLVAFISQMNQFSLAHAAPR